MFSDAFGAFRAEPERRPGCSRRSCSSWQVRLPERVRAEAIDREESKVALVRQLKVAKRHPGKSGASKRRGKLRPGAIDGAIGTWRANVVAARCLGRTDSSADGPNSARWRQTTPAGFAYPLNSDSRFESCSSASPEPNLTERCVLGPFVPLAADTGRHPTR